MIAQLKAAGPSAGHRKLDASLTQADRVKIKVERRALLLRGAPVAIGISAVNALITLWVAYGKIDANVLYGWVGAALVLAAVRFLVWRRFSKHAQHSHALIRYTNYHVAGMTLNGVLWGMLAPIFAMSDMLGHAYLPFIIAGMTAAALSSAGSSWKAVLAFNVPALTSLAVSYGLFIDDGGAAIALVITLYGIATAFLAFQMQAMIERSIRLRSRNDNLLQALTGQVETANEASKRFRALVEASNDVTLIFSPEGVVSYASPATETTLGFAPAALCGQTTKQVVHPDDLENFRAAGGKALSNIGDVKDMPHLCLRKSDESYVAFEGRLTNMLYVPGVEGFVFSGRPTTSVAAPQVHAAV